MRIADKIFPVSQIPRRLRNQLMRTRFGQRVGASLGGDLKPERWIFIVGCYNSGTTLLKDMLAEHPDIGVLPGEGVRFTDSLPRPEEVGWNRMWCRCLDHVRLEPGSDAEERARRIERQWSILYPSGRANLLEKSIANAARLPFLEAHFRPAYFIHLVRDGYAVAEGIRRKAQPGKWENPEYPEKYPIELCAEQWRESGRLIAADRERVERFLEVSYEEMTAAPGDVLRRITDFLGIPSIEEEVFGKSWKVHGVESAIRNMNDRSFARLSVEDLDAIERTAGEELAKRGYGRPISASVSATSSSSISHR